MMYDHQTNSDTEDERAVSMRMWSKDFISSERISLFMTPGNTDERPSFVKCEEFGCNFNTGVGDFEACTLRLGFKKCFVHLDQDDIESKDQIIKSPKSIIPVYYDIELSNDGEIEQIGACTEDGYKFSGLIRTSVRTTKSPSLRTISPEIWNILVEKPGNVMQLFVDWLETLLVNCDSSKNPNIVLVAHYGVSFDHLHLLRTMLKHGIQPPDVYLSDSMVLYKVLINKETSAKLSFLRDKHVAWVEHLAHDADSDAKVMMMIMKNVFPNPKAVYSKFSVHCSDYMKMVGLNLYRVTMTMEERIRNASSG